MANNDIIRHDDIVESGVMKPFQDELIATISILNTMDSELIKIATDLKKAFANSDVKSVDGINKLNQAAKLSNQTFTEREKVLKATREAEQKLLEAVSKESQELAKVRLELQRVTAENKTLAKEQSSTTGAYEKASLQLIRIRKLWKDLAIVQKENTAEGKALKKQMDELDDTLKRVDAAAGQHQRNVGNYADGFRGLSNSINQITREAPAFANSLNTGFMAISNNLPILIDEITRLKKANAELNAQGEKTPSIWSSVAKSFFSIQTAFSAGITLLTLYGGTLVKAIGGLFGFKNATEEATKSQKQFNAQVQIGLESLSASQAKNIEALELQRESYKRLAEQRGATAKELYDIDVEYNERIITEIEYYTKERERVLSAERDRAAKLQTQYDGELLDEQIAASDKRVEQINKEIDDANALRQKYLIGNRTAYIQMSMKELEDQKKLDEERLKQLKDNLELQHKINVDRINGIEDELDRKILLMQEENEYKKLINDIEIQDNKKRHEANLALDERYYRESGELLEESLEKSVNATANAIEKARLLREKDFEEFFKELERQRDIEVAEEEKKAKELLKAQQQLAKDSISLLEQNARQRQQIKQQEIDTEINQSQRREDMLRELAVKGSKDATESIALEQKRQAELEEKRLKELKRQKREELILNGLKVFAANADKYPNRAAEKTLFDIGKLVAGLQSLPAFEKGIEDTGEKGHGVDGKGGFHAILHPHERVLTKGQNKKVGKMTNEELSELAFLYQKGALPEMIMSKHVDDRQIQELKDLGGKIDKLNNTIENRPVKSFQYDEVGRMLVDITQTKHKTSVTKQKVRGFNG